MGQRQAHQIDLPAEIGFVIDGFELAAHGFHPDTGAFRDLSQGQPFREAPDARLSAGVSP